jgi:hypothetical protein
MPVTSPSISLFPSGPLVEEWVTTNDPLESHWLTLAMTTRLIRGPFPDAAAAEFDMFYFAAGEGSPDLIKVLDRHGRPLWRMSWLDEADVTWTTTEGADWDEVRGQLGVDLGEALYRIGFPDRARSWTRSPSPGQLYRHPLSDPDVLTGRWRYVPRLSVEVDHAALRDCPDCHGCGLRLVGPDPAPPTMCPCVRRFP